MVMNHILVADDYHYANYFAAWTIEYSGAPGDKYQQSWDVRSSVMKRKIGYGQKG